MREHDWEPLPGLPERLPEGERILWQGAPSWRLLARRAFHIRALAAYLGALWLWLAVTTLTGGASGWHAAEMVGGNLVLALVTLGLIALFCWLTQRSTAYTITNHRLVIRFGIALPLTVNVPFAMIASAGVKADKVGRGDIALSLLPARRIGYFVLWPHARPWKLARTEPMLRALPDAVQVAQILSRALAASAEQAAPPLPQAAAAEVQPGRATAAA